ncbi:hypothetical protein BJX76DRAFT_108741 [Aspergillus varians]
MPSLLFHHLLATPYLFLPGHVHNTLVLWYLLLLLFVNCISVFLSLIGISWALFPLLLSFQVPLLVVKEDGRISCLFYVPRASCPFLIIVEVTD